MAYSSISLGEQLTTPGATANPGNWVGSPQRTERFEAARSSSGQQQGSSMSPAITSVRNPGVNGSDFRVGSQTTTTTPVAPGIPMPTFGAAPKIDEARIRRLTQTRSAAGQRSLRAALREGILSASYRDNPNVAGMISRKALEGFGQGIAETYTRAQQQATAEEYRDRQMDFKVQQANFNAAMQNYAKRFGSTSTTEYDYTKPGGGDPATRLTFGGRRRAPNVYEMPVKTLPSHQEMRDKLEAYRATRG